MAAFHFLQAFRAALAFSLPANNINNNKGRSGKWGKAFLSQAERISWEGLSVWLWWNSPKHQSGSDGGESVFVLSRGSRGRKIVGGGGNIKRILFSTFSLRTRYRIMDAAHYLIKKNNTHTPDLNRSSVPQILMRSVFSDAISASCRQIIYPTVCFCEAREDFLDGFTFGIYF